MDFSGLYFADPTITGNQYTQPSIDKTKKVKQIMDWAAQLGMKCILTEGTIYTLSCSKSSLIVTDGSADGKRTFASQEALNEYIKIYVQDVMQHPAFYGFVFDDEPTYVQFEPMGQLAAAIHATCPEAYIMVNLYGYGEGNLSREYYMAKSEAQSLVSKYGEAAAYPMIYRNYLNLYYEHLIVKGGLTDIRYDDYPICEIWQDEDWLELDVENNPTTPEGEQESDIGLMHLRTAIIIADFCKEKGISYAKVFQTMGGGAVTSSSSKFWRTPTKNDMYWQMHIGMAMGVKDYSYWTYYPVINMGNYEEYYHDSTFVDFQGNKNELYYWMQDIHDEMQSTAMALSWFQFVGARVLTNGTLGDDDYITQAIKENDTLSLSDPVLGKQGALLFTEMYDETRGNKGFWFVNVTDPAENASQTVTVTFEGYTSLYVYENGVARTVVLDENSTATFELACGQGVFVIPF